jgi:hypothetical protein
LAGFQVIIDGRFWMITEGRAGKNSFENGRRGVNDGGICSRKSEGKRKQAQAFTPDPKLLDVRSSEIYFENRPEIPNRVEAVMISPLLSQVSRSEKSQPWKKVRSTNNRGMIRAAEYSSSLGGDDKRLNGVNTLNLLPQMVAGKACPTCS